MRCISICVISIFQSIALAAEHFEWNEENMTYTMKKYIEYRSECSSHPFIKDVQKSFVHDKLPNHKASEKKILAIHFSGYYLNFGLYSLENGEIATIKKKNLKKPLKTELTDFNWIATEVDKFLDDRDREECIMAGLALPYQMLLDSLSSGIALAVGPKNDLTWPHHKVSPLEDMAFFFEQKNLNIKPCVLANEAVAALMSVDSEVNEHRIGITLGTGTNAAYLKKQDGEETEAINLHWACLDPKIFRRNIFDKDIEVYSTLGALENETFALDRCIGEMGLAQLFRETLVYKNPKWQSVWPLVDLDYISRVTQMADESSKDYKLLKAIKTRSGRILASLITGQLKTMDINLQEDKIIIILSGKLLEQELDYNILKKVAIPFLERNGFPPSIFKFVRTTDAPLVGLVKIFWTHLLTDE